MQNSKKILSFGLYHDLSPKPLPYPTAERVTPALIGYNTSIMIVKHDN